MIHLCGVIIADSGGGIEQDGQQILLHVADLRGVFLHTVHDKPDVFAIQLQKSGAHDLMGKVAACNPSIVPCSDTSDAHVRLPLVYRTGTPPVPHLSLPKMCPSYTYRDTAPED